MPDGISPFGRTRTDEGQETFDMVERGKGNRGESAVAGLGLEEFGSEDEGSACSPSVCAGPLDDVLPKFGGDRREVVRGVTVHPEKRGMRLTVELIWIAL